MRTGQTIHHIGIISIIGLFSILACSDHSATCNSEIYSGEMEMKLNEKEWSGYSYTLETSILGVVGDYYYSPSCRLEQSISLVIPRKSGDFTFSNEVDSISNKSEVLFYFVDDDLFLGYYGIPTNKGNGNLKIEYEEKTKKITGDFSVTLYLLQNFDLPADHPDSIKIRNGKFDAYFK